MPRTLAQMKSVPTFRVPTQISEGPRRYGYGKDGDVANGPGEPPPGFLQATNSVYEWYIYWAMNPALSIGLDMRLTGPPYTGVPSFFSYQVPMQGGRASALGAVPDFVIERTRSGQPVILRLVSEYFHVFTSNAKQISDAFQKQRLSGEVAVIDIYDFTFTGDPTGAAAVQVVKSAAGLIEMPDMLRSGTARRNKR